MFVLLGIIALLILPFYNYKVLFTAWFFVIIPMWIGLIALLKWLIVTPLINWINPKE